MVEHVVADVIALDKHGPAQAGTESPMFWANASPAKATAGMKIFMVNEIQVFDVL